MCQPCPVCGKPALARIDSKTSASISLGRLYRHKYHGQVYLHWIEYGGRAEAIEA